ncbi:MAG: hypothetical protein HUJ25_11850 [Crocinitomicaceae bacterium]|nr:hypothetical protein [Crocinitomicaceae bacterium]
MKKEVINTPNGQTIELIVDSKGFCFCPVCGERANVKVWRPYDKFGYPTYDICSCGFEYGFDDGGEPPYEKSWENYRTKWYAGELDFGNSKTLPKSQKDQQLAQIGALQE